MANTDLHQPKLSTGDDNTLRSYRKLAAAFFGPDSKAVAFIDAEAKDAPNGLDEGVVTSESQMLYLLGMIERR